MAIELPAGWSTKKILGGKSFDDLFQIEGVPLSWFYQRLLLPHVVPKPINTFPQLSRKERPTMAQKVKLTIAARFLARYLYYNERRKCRVFMGQRSDHLTTPKMIPPLPSASPRKALFLSYLDHYQDGHLYRLQGIIDALQQGKKMEPYMLFADKLSSRKMEKGNGLNTIYRHVNERLSRLAEHHAAILHQQWKKIDYRSRERLLGDSSNSSTGSSHLMSSSLWPYLQYAFSFYMSKEFLYLTLLYYHTVGEIIAQENIAIVVTTAQNSLFERCSFAAAKNKGIPALFIQHGLGTLSRPQENYLDNTYVAVFGSYTRQQLLSAGMRPEQVIMTGPVVYDELVPLVNQSRRHQRARYRSYRQPSAPQNSMNNMNSMNNILIVTQPLVEDYLLSKTEYFAAVEKVVRACLPLGGSIHIKLHPRETHFADYKNIEQRHSKIRVHQHQSAGQLYQLLAQAALMINFRFSATILEAAVLEVPIVTIPLCPGQPTYFKDLDPSTHLRLDQDEQELTMKIKNVLGEMSSSTGKKSHRKNRKDKEEKEEDKREEFIRKFFGKMDGRASQRAAELMVKLGSPPAPGNSSKGLKWGWT